MSDHGLTESAVEEAALAWLQEVGYSYIHGSQIAPGEPAAERDDYSQVILAGRLEEAVARLNPHVAPIAREEAVRKVLRPDSPSLLVNNRRFHAMLRDGVTVEYQAEDGTTQGQPVLLFDLDDPERNDFLAVNQFTVKDGQYNRRADVVLFVNGMPLAVIELKNVADEDATALNAFQQLQTYKAEIPNLFTCNEFLVASDGHVTRMGSLTASWEWFKEWRLLEDPKRPTSTLDVLIKEALRPDRILRLAANYTTFEQDPNSDRLTKILAGYHQFYAVEEALQHTIRAIRPEGDKRCGVVWHTQGSGKSLTMTFFAGRIVRDPAMQNPTLIILTDRNDLDDQLFGQFARCQELLGQTPVQADQRSDLQRLLQVASGGVVFTTIQKFLPEGKHERFPLLSDRRNIVVIADEAHRTQYDMIDGFARHMRDALPNASFIGFTGTPIELGDKNTRAVFGDYISVYDIQRAVEDKATVPIFYESRLARIELPEAELPQIDAEFDQITESEEETRRDKLKTKWAAQEALVGSEKRVKLVAADLVAHFEKRLEAIEGKAMVVCMSRRICIDMYYAIVALRPEWHSEDDAQGAIKVIMTGAASDDVAWQPHIRNKPRRRELADRFKDPADPFRIVIVRDMWLTGFDAPCLHTMYIDKPMQGHGLMQAIARVNRVFKDKVGGVVVDYIGLAESLRSAMNTYTQAGGEGRTAIDTAESIAAMLEKYEQCCDLFHGFDWTAWTAGTAVERVTLMPAAQQHIMAQENGVPRYTRSVTDLSKAHSLCPTCDAAEEIRSDIAFFQATLAVIKKTTRGDTSSEDRDHAIRQLVSRAIVPDGQIIDVFSAAGLKRPDVSILDEAFLAEVKAMPHKNLAVELLQRLLKDEIKEKCKRNVVQTKTFSEMLRQSVQRYHNRAITTQEILDEMIRMAKELRDAHQRGENLGLNHEELAFYDALAQNDSAIQVLGVDELKVIATELVTKVRKSVTIDWTVRESARARIRIEVRRILRQRGYPPDLQDEATKLVLEQAEALSAEWAVRET